jgi:hypothetical protein
MRRLFLAGLLVFFASSLKAEIKPGTVIDSTNVSNYKELLPEAVYKRVEKGEYVLKVGKLGTPDLKNVYSERFYSASSKNAGRYKLLDNGGMIDASTGKRPVPIGPGLPFPDIDEADPQAGTKIMWNFFSTEFQANSQEVMWILKAIRGRSVEVEVIGKQARLSYDFRTDPLTPKEDITYKEISLYLAPADLFGTAVLTWRWTEPEKWDSGWMYIPSLRRTRRTSSANRSDPVGATDYMVDDVNGYAGKVEFFKWKLIKKTTMLLPYIPDSDGITVTFPRKCEWEKKKGAKAFVQPRYSIKWAYKEGAPKLAGWWPLNIVWIERPVYIVEGISKDPYYSVGKQWLVVDAETYRVHMKFGWDRGGTYWRTQVMTQGYYIAPDNSISAAAAEISFLVDEKRNRASTSDRTAPEVVPTIFNLDLKEELFSMSNFVNYGK